MKRKQQIVISRFLNRKVTLNATILILAGRDEKAKVTFTCGCNNLVENNQFLIHLSAASVSQLADKEASTVLCSYHPASQTEKAIIKLANAS